MWWMTTKWSLKPSMSGPQFSVLSIVTTLSFLWQDPSCSVSLQILDNSLCHVSHLVSHHHHVWVLPSLLPSHPLLVATDQVPSAHPPPDPVYCQNISDSALFTIPALKTVVIQYTFRFRFPALVNIPTQQAGSDVVMPGDIATMRRTDQPGHAFKCGEEWEE